MAPTTLAGRVTDLLGKPIAKARVYVVQSSGGRLQVATNKDGRYEIAVPSGAHSLVIAVGKVHTFRQVLATEGKATTLDVEVEIDQAAGEVIRIIDQQLPAPAVPPKPTVDPRISLPYSEEAMERDAWARGWLLLDVDETGQVTRLKLLKRPGFDLDQIAIDEAFKLRFEPARDAAGRPVRTYVVWTMEWPSWGWLVTGNGTVAGKPKEYQELRPRMKNDRGAITNTGKPTLKETDPDERPNNDEIAAARGDLVGRPWARPLVVADQKQLSTVPCLGSGPLNLDLRNRAYRDCSPPPDSQRADALPWITRENAKTALAELARTAPRPLKRVRGSRVPELTASAITGALLVALVVSYERYDTYSGRLVRNGQDDFEQWRRDHDALGSWKSIMLGLSAGLVVSGGVTAFLWSRGQSYENFSVQPTDRGGAAVSYGRSF